MRLLIAILILSATPVFGQIVPAPSSGPSNPVVQFKANGFGYQYDLSGRSTNLYDMGNGMTGYTSRDQNGQITSQGTIYNAIPRPEPLRVPQLQYRTNAESDREVCATLIRC